MTWHPGIPIEYRNQIITGDARLLAPVVPNQSCQLAFADPPYWVGFDYGSSRDDALPFTEPGWLVKEMTRIARYVCITPGIANLYDYPRPAWILGWFKFGSTGRNWSGGFNCWEPILLYGDIDFRLWQDAVNIPTYRNHLNINGVYIKAAKNICPKPEPLIAWLLEGFTNSGDTVIDPMVGTGTTPTVCKKSGRNYIAFEILPDVAEQARQRVANTQPPLFTMQPQQAPLFAGAGEEKS